MRRDIRCRWGRQQIVFANHQKQITALPEIVIKRIRRYEMRK